MKNRSKNTSALFWIILLGAFLRVLYFLFWAKTPYFSGLFLDELYHHLWAKRIAAGNVLPSGVFFRAPLYPYLLGVIYMIFGDGGFAPRIFQHLWGLLSVVPIFLAANEIFKNRRLALFAAALWAICPIQIFFESRLLLDSVFSAGIAWLVWILLLVRRKRTHALCAFAGFWLGILAIMRPTALVLAPILLVFLFRYVRWRTIITALAVIVPIAPITISNAVNGDFVLIASQGGINFYIGNNEHSDGASAVIPELGRNWQYRQCVALAEKENGKEMKLSEVSNFFFKRGFNFWRNDTRSAIKLFGKKILLLLTSPEIGNNGNIYFILRNSYFRYLLWFWALLFSLAMTGFFFVKFEHKWFFAFSAAIYGLTIAAFFVCARFRLPIIPMLAIPAAGAKVIYDSIGAKKIIPIAFVVCILIFSLFDPYDWRRNDDALSHFALGNIFLRNGNLHDAESEYNSALKLNPSARGVHLNIGALKFKQGFLDSAEYHFEREIDVRGEICRATSNIGVLERIKRNYTMALHYGGKSLEKCLAEPSAIFNYAMTLFSAGYFHRADSLLRAELPKYSDNLRLMNLAGASALALADTARAESLWTTVIADKNRSFVELYNLGTIYSEQSGVGATTLRIRSWAYYNLAQISAARQNAGKTQKLLNLAVASDTTFAQGFAALGAIFLAKNELLQAQKKLERAQKLGLKTPELFFNLAAISARKGDIGTAKKFLNEALQIDPNFILARQALDALENSNYR